MPAFRAFERQEVVAAISSGNGSRAAGACPPHLLLWGLILPRHMAVVGLPQHGRLQHPAQSRGSNLLTGKETGNREEEGGGRAACSTAGQPAGLP